MQYLQGATHSHKEKTSDITNFRVLPNALTTTEYRRPLSRYQWADIMMNANTLIFMTP